MKENSNKASNKTWLEPVLAEHLRPVEAPQELRNRIQLGRPTAARWPGGPWRMGLVAVAALLVAGTSAILTVHGASPVLSLQSASAPEIQAWVKENAGLDMPFPAHLSDQVRLSGARVSSNGVEIDYFVRNHPERLMIARAASEHKYMEHGAKKVSWTMGGQTYAVEDAELACLLCHS